MHQFRLMILPCVWVICALAQTDVQGQNNSGTGLVLPRDPAQWVNSPPIPAELLKGKAAFLWFYEEQCPSCRKRWPELLKAAESFQGEPIVFIAVNSGNSRGDVEGYLRDVGCRWPTIVDFNREFEKASGVNEISLQNIHQVRVISADGRMSPGDFRAVEESAKRALAGAKWNVDPKTIPSGLLTQWQAVEFGNFPAASALIKQGLKSTKPEVKEGATVLNDYVQAEMQKSLAGAESAVAKGGWPAYVAYKTIGDQYAGFDLPPDVAAKVKELAAEKDVKAELDRYKQLGAIKKSAQSTSVSARKSALTRLKKFAEDHAGTAAGDEAAELLKAVGG